MTDRLACDAFVTTLLDSVADADRDVAAIELVSAACAHLVLLVGARAGAAAIYAIADEAATRHVPGEVARDV